MAACWGNRGVRHNARYRTVTAHLTSSDRTGESFSSHREIKREGDVPKGLFSTPPILGGYVGASGFKDRFA